MTIYDNAIKHAADAHTDLIPPPYDALYEALGYDGFSALFEHLGGLHVYIPSMRNVLADAIRAQALKECKNRMQTHEQIAKKFGYTGRHLRRMLNGK